MNYGVYLNANFASKQPNDKMPKEPIDCGANQYLCAQVIKCSLTEGVCRDFFCYNENSCGKVVILLETQKLSIFLQNMHEIVKFFY